MDAPLGSVEFAESDELERLRRRAYGPDADIAGDAAAQDRLSELEAAHRRQLTPILDVAASGNAVVPEGVPVPEPVEGSRTGPALVREAVDGKFAEHEPAGGSVTEPAGGPIADSGPVANAAPPPWWRRRRFVILGGTIAALVLNVAVVAGTSQLIASGSTPIPGETSMATMPPLPAGQGAGYYVPAPSDVLELRSVGADADAPNDRYGTLDALGISADELRRYEDFQGLNIWSGESRYGVECLLVAVPVQGLRNGLSTEACSLAGLDTSADLSPIGRGLIRFVLRGDHVNVYVYESGADPNASQR